MRKSKNTIRSMIAPHLLDHNGQTLPLLMTFTIHTILSLSDGEPRFCLQKPKLHFYFDLTHTCEYTRWISHQTLDNKFQISKMCMMWKANKKGMGHEANFH
uniref:Uncharacterized protein n=1 Tax=Monopterus albus TaxID=43700 RepID=A0A3Q3JJW5_MONAL